MRYQTEQLRVVRAEGGDWHTTVREQVDSGRNFFLILPGQPDAISEFCKSFGLKSDCLRASFARSDLMRMGQYIDAADFDEMMRAWSMNQQVVFLEQIDFPTTRPPRVKPFIVYSSLWGILSQHDDLMAARRGMEEAEHWQDRGRLSQPAIYRWDRNRWNML